MSFKVFINSDFFFLFLVLELAENLLNELSHDFKGWSRDNDIFEIINFSALGNKDMCAPFDLDFQFLVLVFNIIITLVWWVLELNFFVFVSPCRSDGNFLDSQVLDLFKDVLIVEKLQKSGKGLILVGDVYLMHIIFVYIWKYSSVKRF